MTQQQLEVDYEERKVTRRVNVDLTVTEEAQLHRESRKILASIEELEGDFEKKKKEFNASHKELDAQLRDAINKECDSRDEECIEKRFFEMNVVQVWYEDKLIEERAMTPEERQMAMGPMIVEADDSDESEEEVDPETDLKETMREERSRTKPSLVDMK